MKQQTRDAITPGEQSIIFQWLREFNQAENGDWWTATEREENQARPLFVTVYSNDQELVGGLIGSTSLKWLRIEIMAVKECSRRRGIGRLLLGAAEKEAHRRGCEYSFVDTMEFQSPNFYTRCGYQIAGRIPDWDSFNHTKFFLTKTLNDSSASGELA
ncbi:GNAT family N-acetyltransferase [Stieleria sp. JC731]|uniref:GNAT family N-acetyltransferase n=1 Tax=Pirellulaceae TaxID=2691357 RepID=UPI001E3F41DE|nr:GNAT family N-acetyltransferase [Stieleria sp. JC731]MCC9602826.1 GNAT family N-acetyltransferase [Stieleria sp. JC731]